MFICQTPARRDPTDACLHFDWDGFAGSEFGTHQFFSGKLQEILYKIVFSFKIWIFWKEI